MTQISGIQPDHVMCILLLTVLVAEVNVLIVCAAILYMNLTLSTVQENGVWNMGTLGSVLGRSSLSNSTVYRNSLRKERYLPPDTDAGTAVEEAERQAKENALMTAQLNIKHLWQQVHLQWSCCIARDSCDILPLAFSNMFVSLPHWYINIRLNTQLIFKVTVCVYINPFYT